MTIIFVGEKKIELDHCQNQAFRALSSIFESHNFQKKRSFFNKIINKKNNDSKRKGLYIHGRVGRGKSMLMRHFFNDFKDREKIYLHFNSFMQEVHRELYKIRQIAKNNAKKDDLIDLVTKNIVKDAKLLCLDEFQVDDVADALILRRIFSYLFDNDIILIFTSNSRPENLYQNGLQRELFLKFVHEVLYLNCDIFNLDSDQDYREKFLHKIKKHYFYPINQENSDKILNIFGHLSKNSKTTEDFINVGSRVIKIAKSCENIAIFDFKDLCEESLGVADYQAICNKYNIIFLLNVPKLKKEDRNEAKRLILFIDEVYERKVNLLILAQVEMEKIYEEGKDSDKFKRTVSRLKEITSDGYGFFKDSFVTN